MSKQMPTDIDLEAIRERLRLHTDDDAVFILSRVPALLQLVDELRAEQSKLIQFFEDKLAQAQAECERLQGELNALKPKCSRGAIIGENLQ